MQDLDIDQDPVKAFSCIPQKTQAFTLAFSFKVSYIWQRRKETITSQWHTQTLGRSWPSLSSGAFLTKPIFTEPYMFLNTRIY